MPEVYRDSALVVKKETVSVLLLIIKKKWVMGNFRCSVIPSIGALIMIDWRSTGSRDTIDICRWNCYSEEMGGFVVSESTEAGAKFTGMFYTMGKIMYGGEALETPSIFNNVIGVVQDTANVLDRNYIGKLEATVSFDEHYDGFHWTLISVDEYLKKGVSEIPDQKRPFKGVVSAINRGRSRAVNYITSRYFPHDVRFYTWKNVDPKLPYSLLGREVNFAAYKDPRSQKWSCVVGTIEPNETNNFSISREGDLFEIELAVEYIGCTDEHGCILVWSDQLEFVVDNKRLFEDREYGIYRVHAAPHYLQLQFARWSVKYVGELIKPLRGHMSRFEEVCTSASSCNHDEKFTPKKDVEKTLRTCLHRCMESVKVRAAIKQADPEFFNSLVATLMRV
ncbi:hypothetical protein V3C99_018750 [Haemonchus contortus]